MATTTTKLALTKPDGTDLVDIAVLNANADKLDLSAGAFTCTSVTRPATPWNGQLIFETDTNNFYVYISSSAVWLSVGGAVISTTKPTTAGKGNFWMDPDTMKVYIYYTDANSSQWVEVGGGSSEVPTTANATTRDAMYPTPQQGNKVFRNDLGFEETYYALYNVSTNPGGKTPAGWYREAGQIIQTVQGTTTTMTSNSTTTYADTSLTVTITPQYATSKILLFVNQTGITKNSGNANNSVRIKLLKNGTDVRTIALDMGYTGTAIYNGGLHASTIHQETAGVTTAITYKTQFANAAATAAVYVQDNSTMSTITAIEVSQ